MKQLGCQITREFIQHQHNRLSHDYWKNHYEEFKYGTVFHGDEIENQTMKIQYNNHLKYMNLNKNQKGITPKRK